MLTINASGCHINFKPFFFFLCFGMSYKLLMLWDVMEKINYFYPKSKHKTVRLFYFMFKTIRLFKPCSIKKPKILILLYKNVDFLFFDLLDREVFVVEVPKEDLSLSFCWEDFFFLLE